MPSLSVKSWDADLVAVEVVGLLSAFAFCGCQVVDLRQGFIAFGIGVDIGIFGRPKRIRFPLRGRLKGRNYLRSTHTLRRDWRFCAGYGLLTG